MEPWHPRSVRIEPVNTSAGGYRVDCPYKLVLHTVEGGTYSPSDSSYYGHQSYPHFTVGDEIWQHFPIDQAARALYNAPGGVETNAARAIQVEIVWWAGRIADLPERTMANLADLARWLVDQGVIPLDFAAFRGDGSYGENAPQRFGPDEWYRFAGICGHQHVPENDHWDPGGFPIDRLRAAMGATAEEDDMFDGDDRATLIGLETRFEELKRELREAAGTDNWHQVGELLGKKLDRVGSGGAVALTDADVQRIAKAVADEQARRQQA